MNVDWSVGHYESTAEQLLPASREVLDVAGVRRGDRVLDVGCGTGNAALLAASRGAVVTAVDPAERLLDVARERAAREGHRIEFLAGDAAALPVGDAAFDVVVSVFGAIFAADARRALTEMTRALAADGRLVLSAWLPGGAIGRMNQTAIDAVRSALGAPPGEPPFAWDDERAVASIAEPLGLTLDRAERTLAFTAASPERFVEAEADNHPVAVTGRRVLMQHGVDEAAFRTRLVEVLRQGNEDPRAFRATSRYVIWTMRPA